MGKSNNMMAIASLYEEAFNDYNELRKDFRSVEKEIEQKAKEIFNQEGKASVGLYDDNGSILCYLQLSQYALLLEQINIFADAMEQPYDKISINTNEKGLGIYWTVKNK